ncbi:MAG: Uma2 family endonuclease [Gemmatimonadaceae bacterium]
MSARTTEWTVEMVHALPDDGNRYEVIDGELLVSPSPSRLHQRAVGNLCMLLRAYANVIGLEVLTAPLGVNFSPRTEVQPDILVVPFGEEPPSHYVEGRSLNLAVEVASPSSRWTDRGKKLGLFQREEIAEYWVVDIDMRAIERWRLPPTDEPEVLTTILRWQPLPGHDALVIDIVAYFRTIHRD